MGGLTIKDSDIRITLKWFSDIFFSLWGVSSSCSANAMNNSVEVGEKLRGEKARVCPLVCSSCIFTPFLHLRYDQTLSCRPWKLSSFQGRQRRSLFLKHDPLGLEKACD